MSSEKKKPDLYAYMVTGPERTPYFTKIGAAWKNKKDGYGIVFDAFPVNGEIVLFRQRNKN